MFCESRGTRGVKAWKWEARGGDLGLLVRGVLRCCGGNKTMRFRDRGMGSFCPDYWRAGPVNHRLALVPFLECLVGCWCLENKQIQWFKSPIVARSGCGELMPQLTLDWKHFNPWGHGGREPLALLGFAS